MESDQTPVNSVLNAANRLRGDTFSDELRDAINAIGDPQSFAAARLEIAARLGEVTSPAGVGFLAVWLGGGVENGFAPEPTTLPILDTMLRWMQTIDSLEDPEGGPASPLDDERRIGLERLGQGLVAHLARSPDQLAHIATRVDVVQELERVEYASAGVMWVLELLQKRSGTLIVLHVPERVGFRVTYENLSNCFHLFTLLQGALAGKVSDVKPASEQTLAIARGEQMGPGTDTASWHYGRGDLPQGSIEGSIWGEASPDSIPAIDGQQVLLLWPGLLGSRSWDAGFFGPFLSAAPPQVVVQNQLTKEQLNTWWTKLNLPITSSQSWWKLW